MYRANFKALSLLEAGGIEPPSRDSFRDASTCVVGLLCLGASGASRQAQAAPSLAVFSPMIGQTAIAD